MLSASHHPSINEQFQSLAPLVPGSEGVSGYSDNQCHARAKGAKNIRGNRPSHHCFLNLCTYNTWTLNTEASLLALKEKISYISGNAGLINPGGVSRHKNG